MTKSEILLPLDANDKQMIQKTIAVRYVGIPVPHQPQVDPNYYIQPDRQVVNVSQQ